jgi:Chaperone of endosialidase
MSENRKTDDALTGVDEGKRATLTRLLKGSAFAAPIVASFAIADLTISKAQATGPSSALPVSDQRLKTEVERLLTLPSGLGLYRFRYVWSGTEYVGVMAQEVREAAPAAVIEGADGFLRVDYAMLGLEMLTYATWQERGGDICAAAA